MILDVLSLLILVEIAGLERFMSFDRSMTYATFFSSIHLNAYLRSFCREEISFHPDFNSWTCAIGHKPCKS